MTARLLAILNACVLSIVLSPHVNAALATADVVFDWSSFSFTTTGDLVANQVAPSGDEGSALAEGGLLDTGSTVGFGGLDLSSTGPSSSASLLTTTNLIDASASTSLGFGGATFERFFSFQAASGSGSLSLSVDVELQAEVQGAASFADAEALFGYEVGGSGAVGSLAGLEMSGSSGDQSQTLPTTLSFSVFMQEGDVIDMFAEGGVEVSAVPLPAAAWLFGSGIVSLIAVARRKKTCVT
jgi:hypothetical protein